VILMINMLLNDRAVCSDVADHRPVTWDISTTYPADTVSGIAVEQFARELKAQAGETIVSEARFETPVYPDRFHTDPGRNTIQVVSLFAGELSRTNPLFALSTLPFGVRSLTEARALACAAKPSYRKALLAQGLELLFISPWPPTGVWSRDKLSSRSDFVNLRLRTYDDASTEVFALMGAKPLELPPGSVKQRLQSGVIDAVLSSGDGEVGRSFSRYLPNFTAVRYAYPLSFVVMKRAAFKALPAETRVAVQAAARATEQTQWDALPLRVQNNFGGMAAVGVHVNGSVDPFLQSAMRRAGAQIFNKWSRTVLPADAALLKEIQHRRVGKRRDCLEQEGDSFTHD
jgi:TRAP-type transport system periplasmic protein